MSGFYRPQQRGDHGVDSSLDRFIDSIDLSLKRPGSGLIFFMAIFGNLP
jgi:hypothetical protein